MELPLQSFFHLPIRIHHNSDFIKKIYNSNIFFLNIFQNVISHELHSNFLNWYALKFYSNPNTMTANLHAINRYVWYNIMHIFLLTNLRDPQKKEKKLQLYCLHLILNQKITSFFLLHFYFLFFIFFYFFIFYERERKKKITFSLTHSFGLTVTTAQT